MEYATLLLSIENHIAHVRFNRPQRANALNQTAWDELRRVFERLDEDDTVRAIILSGEGKHFCSGIDLELLMSVATLSKNCEGRKREQLRKQILALQAPINAIEQCSKPVIAAIHGGCIGGAVDIVSACDMRYCTQDAYFTIREIDMGMVADLGYATAATPAHSRRHYARNGLYRTGSGRARSREDPSGKQNLRNKGVHARSRAGTCRNDRLKITLIHSGYQAHPHAFKGSFRSRRPELHGYLERRDAAFQ